MGLRFRKSIKILPGVRVNYGLHSTSLSIGGKGFRTTYSSTGRVTRSVGIPGTGISYVTSSGGSRSNRNSSPRVNTYQPVTLPMSTPQTQRVDIAPPIAAPVVDIDDLRESIQNIFRYADATVNWRRILISDANPGIENWDYFKSKAEDVLNGNLDTYFQIISDINPVDDLLQYGSEFECGTDDPRMMTVGFTVNSDAVLRDATTLPQRVYNDLLQDYVCGCAIRVARDILALLPLRRVIINTSDSNRPILSVDFDRKNFEQIDFSTGDASDIVESLSHRMNFNPDTGFGQIRYLDE